MKMGLTPQARRLLGYIDACMSVRDGVPPSYDEMRAHMDLRSKSGVYRLLNQLEERGRIRRLPYRSRAIEVVSVPQTVALPARLYREAAASAARQNRSVGALVADAVRCWLDTD